MAADSSLSMMAAAAVFSLAMIHPAVLSSLTMIAAAAPPAGHLYRDTDDSFVSFLHGAVALLMAATACISVGDHKLLRRCLKELLHKLLCRRFKERRHCVGIAMAEGKAALRDGHKATCSLLQSDADFAGAGHGIKEGKAKTAAPWVAATAAPHHATGNRDLLSGFITEHDDQFVHAVDGIPRKVLARGAVITDSVVLPDVWYVPGLTENLVSVSQLVELHYNVEFSCGDCCISSTDGKVIGKGQLQKGGHYVIDFLMVPLAI